MKAMILAFVAIAGIAVGSNYLLSNPSNVERFAERMNLDVNLDGASGESVRLD